MSSNQAVIDYRFGRIELRPNEQRLLVDRQPVTAGSRAFDLLVVLVDRAGQLVTKDEFLERVWPKLVVEENNLQVQVSTLRKILRQEAIVTIPGRGYRFAPRLEHIDDGERSPTPAAHKHNLPEPLTSFVGHENDLAQYAQMPSRC
jgi:DNA-binding winged helix-turn-helix (wHTH) protein